MRWGMSEKVGNIDYQEAAEAFRGNGAGGLLNLGPYQGTYRR